MKYHRYYKLVQGVPDCGAASAGRCHGRYRCQSCTAMFPAAVAGPALIKAKVAEVFRRPDIRARILAANFRSP